MELDRKEVGNTILLSFAAPMILDDTNAQDFKNTLMATIGEGKNLLLDFSKLSLISSSGIGALVAVAALANERKVMFGFHGLSANLMNLFKVTKLYMIFQIFKTEEEALQAFNS